jgi:hypothetical protein
MTSRNAAQNGKTTVEIFAGHDSVHVKASSWLLQEDVFRDHEFGVGVG